MTYHFLSLEEDLLHDVLEPTLLLELLIQLVQQESVPCVLDRVVSMRLNVLLEKEPGEEAERQFSALARDGINVDSVQDLFRGNEYV